MSWPIDPDLGFLQTRSVDAFGADTGGRTVPHTGVDFAPYKVGAALPVYAVESGTVFYTGGGKADRSGPGLNVRIHHPSGFWLYGHLSRVDVRNGQAVRKGQQLGLMGASGGANGVHLHVTRFTTKAAALANAVPSKKAGLSVPQWAKANNLADPLPVIKPPKAPEKEPPVSTPVLEAHEMPIIVRTSNAHPKAPQYFAVTENGIAPFERTESKALNAFRQVLNAMNTARDAGVTDVVLSVYQLRTFRDYVNQANGRPPFVPDVLAK